MQINHHHHTALDLLHLCDSLHEKWPLTLYVAFFGTVLATGAILLVSNLW